MSFKITSHSGFHMIFENGWTASVQFGPGNYCSNHYNWNFDEPKTKNMWESYDAEVAAWPKDGKMVELQNGNTVGGWVSADNVLLFLNWVAGEDHSSPPQNLRE